MQPLFCPRNTSLSDLRLRRIIPTTLPNSLFDVEQTPARSYWQTCYNITWDATGKKVAKILSAGQIHDPKCSLMHPGHKWILPQQDLQWVPYVPPCKQRMPKQRVPKQRVTLEEGEPANSMPSQLPTLAHITDAPPIMSAPNPTTRQALPLTKCTHSWQTNNNILVASPLLQTRL